MANITEVIKTVKEDRTMWKREKIICFYEDLKKAKIFSVKENKQKEISEHEILKLAEERINKEKIKGRNVYLYLKENSPHVNVSQEDIIGEGVTPRNEMVVIFTNEKVENIKELAIMNVFKIEMEFYRYSTSNSEHIYNFFHDVYKSFEIKSDDFYIEKLAKKPLYIYEINNYRKSVELNDGWVGQDLEKTTDNGFVNIYSSYLVASTNYYENSYPIVKVYAKV